MDANALYLSCIMENMPTVITAEWRKGEDGLFTRKLATNVKELYWLEWMSHTLGVEIRHTHNGGQQKVGKYYVDGFIQVRKWFFSSMDVITMVTDVPMIPEMTESASLKQKKLQKPFRLWVTK